MVALKDKTLQYFKNIMFHIACFVKYCCVLTFSATVLRGPKQNSLFTKKKVQIGDVTCSSDKQWQNKNNVLNHK